MVSGCLLLRFSLKLKHAINIRRLALSVGIVGAITIPLVTGNLKRGLPDPSQFHWEDDRDRYIEQRGLEPWICSNMPNITNPDTRQICIGSEAVARSHSVLRTSIRLDATLLLLRDVLLGFVVPAALVLLVPSAFRRYWRWLTNSG